MQNPPPTKSRPWKIIADEVSGERDPVKLSRLIEELNRALDEQASTANRNPEVK
jgi:hypothetical protein